MDEHGAHELCRAMVTFTRCPGCGIVTITMTDTTTGEALRSEIPSVAACDALIAGLGHARSAIIDREASRN